MPSIEIKNLEKWRFPLIILALLLASTGLLVNGFGGSQNTSNGNLSGNLLPTPTRSAAPTQTAYVQSNTFGTIVYGHWSPSFTQIRTVNTDGTNNFTIANLPSNIKDIHLLSNTKLLYIADTNDLDQGKRIVIYDVLNRRSDTVVQTENNFVIDDVIISPDKSYIAWWEIKAGAKTSKTLLGSDSAVYLKNINTNVQSRVLYERAESTIPIHYPLFFDKNNRLFMDTFVPNQGRGFYLGVSYVEPENATRLISIPYLTKGKFSSQPIISPNDNKIAYLGYDPNAKLQLEIELPEILKRNEFDNPNLIQLLDLDTLTLQTIADSRDGKQYGPVAFSSDGKYLIYPIYQVKIVDGKTTLDKVNEIETYDLSDGAAKRIKTDNLPFSNRIIDYINNQLVYAETQTDDVASLGETYEPMIKKFVTYDLNEDKLSPYAESKNIQFLSYQPRSKKTGEIITLDETLQKLNLEEKYEGLQLSQVIVPEAKIVKNRAVQQNNIVTHENTTLDPDPTATPSLPPGCSSAGCPGCCDIFVRLCGGSCGHHPESSCPAWDRLMGSGYKCYASPLYLYPEKTTSVEIKPKVADKVYSSWPPLTDQTWKLIANPNGDLTHEGKTFNKIEYSYISSDVSAPIAGVVSNIRDLKQTLYDYGSKLGLINKELADFTKFWVTELGKYESGYFFISHFDKEKASKIMNFDINPKSDTFIQVIMYFKPLEKPYTPKLPDFPEIPERRGFTVVDWSGIVDW